MYQKMCFQTVLSLMIYVHLCVKGHKPAPSLTLTDSSHKLFDI